MLFKSFTFFALAVAAVQALPPAGQVETGISNLNKLVSYTKATVEGTTAGTVKDQGAVIVAGLQHILEDTQKQAKALTQAGAAWSMDDQAKVSKQWTTLVPTEVALFNTLAASKSILKDQAKDISAALGNLKKAEDDLGASLDKALPSQHDKNLSTRPQFMTAIEAAMKAFN
ncbi:hypothetical protein PT974_03642 [Cladobotryum mycophilum]|uniref:Uncharacterized protein n=1 Tax=Cladobotryum mycophilum TaxID=491253 RepID=A0ABR0SSW3_9HYPO